MSTVGAPEGTGQIGTRFSSGWGGRAKLRVGGKKKKGSPPLRRAVDESGAGDSAFGDRPLPPRGKGNGSGKASRSTTRGIVLSLDTKEIKRTEKRVGGVCHPRS